MPFSDFFKGLGAYRNAHRAIREHRLWPFMIIPGLLSLGYLVLLIGIGWSYFPEISAYINENWIPDFMKWQILRYITQTVLWLFLILTGYITYQPVILVLFSPVLAYLSEVTERRIYGGPGVPFSLKTLTEDLIRSILINGRNLIRMLLFILLAWLLVWIPLAGPIVSAVLIFSIQAFYNGCALADYTLERKRYTVKERIVFSKSHRARIVGVGTGFMGMILIPILGWVFAPTYGTVAATIAVIETLNGSKDIKKAEGG